MVKYYFHTYLWGYLWKWLKFESVEWRWPPSPKQASIIQPMIPTSAGEHYPIHPIEQKSRVRAHFALFAWTETSIFPSLRYLHSWLSGFGLKLGCIALAKSLQSCPTLCDPIDGSPPDSPVPGILQARTLEWVAISFSNAWKWKVKMKSLSRVQLLATLWTAAYQAPLSMGFSRQKY